jgi:glycosyltransferase involved in cell wall biosynthesis
LGVDVTLICTQEQCVEPAVRYRCLPILPSLSPDRHRRGKVVRIASLLANIMISAKRTANALAAEPPQPVITHFSEYLAPLWAWRFHRLRRRGFSFHTVLHDPKRNYRVGPEAWHGLSVRMAFDLCDTVFIHGAERGDAPTHLPIVTIPLGVFEGPEIRHTRARVRSDLGIPDEKPLLIQFGFIRDYKNIDLAIRALTRLPDVYLLVAGAEHAGSRPAAFYQSLADELGVADRCRFLIGFQSPGAAASLFAASDVLCLTYSAEFCSGSGVLATAVHHRLPALVSCGLSEMEGVVQNYGIGRWVTPDSVDAVVDGVLLLLSNPPVADWERYEREQSWRRNAELILAAVADTRSVASQG